MLTCLQLQMEMFGFLHLLNNFHILSPILQNKEGEILYIIINLISHQNLLTVLL